MILGIKSAATVNKRAISLFLYAKEVAGRGKLPFPIVESELAHHCFQLRRSVQFTSRANSLRQALLGSLIIPLA